MPVLVSARTSIAMTGCFEPLVPRQDVPGDLRGAEAEGVPNQGQGPP